MDAKDTARVQLNKEDLPSAVRSCDPGSRPPDPVRPPATVSKETSCVFSFEPAHLSAMSMTKDTSTVLSSSCMNPKSAFVVPNSLSLNFRPNVIGGSCTWPGSAIPPMVSPSMNGNMYRSPLPTNLGYSPQPQGPMFAPPSVRHDQMYMQRMYHMQMLQRHQHPPSNMLMHPGTPPLWAPSAPDLSIPKPKPREEQSSPAFVPRPVERAAAPLQAYRQRTEPSDGARRIYRIEQPWAQQPPSSVVKPIPLYAGQQQLLGKEVKTPPHGSIGQASKPSEPTSTAYLLTETKTSAPERLQAGVVEPPCLSRPVKKRSVIDDDMIILLEAEFQKNKSPNQIDIAELAERYHLTKGAVRAWFTSRRQKQKKMERESGLAKQKKVCRESGSLKVPSQNYDITVEVPSIDPRDRGSVVHQDYDGR